MQAGGSPLTVGSTTAILCAGVCTLPLARVPVQVPVMVRVITHRGSSRVGLTFARGAIRGSERRAGDRRRVSDDREGANGLRGRGSRVAARRLLNGVVVSWRDVVEVAKASRWLGMVVDEPGAPLIEVDARTTESLEVSDKLGRLLHHGQASDA